MVDLRTLAPGDRVQGEFLVVNRSERTKANGDPFVVLTLGNSYGTIETAPIWMEKMSWADGAEKGAIVQAVGDVSLYERTGSPRRQIVVTAPVRVLPRDHFDMYDFLPSIGDTTKYWDWIDKVRAEMKSTTLRRVVDLFFADDNFRVQFEKAPGSPTGHHSQLGGLLLHVFEVTSVARHSARTMKANVDLVVAGALLHDIGKVEAYDIGLHGFGNTVRGALMGYIVLGVLMLERAVAEQKEEVCTSEELMEIQHMILSHNGSLELGSPVRPMTLEAEIVHWADEMSAKGSAMHEALENPDNFQPNSDISDKRVWNLDRRIWRRPFNWK